MGVGAEATLIPPPSPTPSNDPSDDTAGEKTTLEAKTIAPWPSMRAHG